MPEILRTLARVRALAARPVRRVEAFGGFESRYQRRHDLGHAIAEVQAIF